MSLGLGPKINAAHHPGGRLFLHVLLAVCMCVVCYFTILLGITSQLGYSMGSLGSPCLSTYRKGRHATGAPTPEILLFDIPASLPTLGSPRPSLGAALVEVLSRELFAGADPFAPRAALSWDLADGRAKGRSITPFLVRVRFRVT